MAEPYTGLKSPLLRSQTKTKYDKDYSLKCTFTLVNLLEVIVFTFLGAVTGFIGVFAGYYAGISLRELSGMKPFTTENDPFQVIHSFMLPITVTLCALVLFVVNLSSILLEVELKKRIGSCIIVNCFLFTFHTIYFLEPCLRK